MAQRVTRLRIRVSGAVQGVGFRPFVYRLAKDFSLCGFVTNSPQGATIELEGPHRDINQFLKALHTDLPFPASIRNSQIEKLRPTADTDFRIAESQYEGAKSATILPDIATCPLCLAEMRDPSNFRYRYPFINCTHCGPRYSILRGLPYDRPLTSMSGFAMCEQCSSEYTDPANRRFHAQPIACPACGPHIELWNVDGAILADRDAALEAACEVLRRGGILAFKGIGGFHLMVDAASEDAVRRLRDRKRREAKPLAVMVPDLDSAKCIAELDEVESSILLSPQAPILVARAVRGSVAPSVAPENPNIGVMLPYSPLHWLLMEAFGRPLVATSGNLTDEPICTDEFEAIERFGGLADALLVHNRPIVRPIDDSVVTLMAGNPMILRRARGYSPLPIELPTAKSGAVAVGAHLKNSVAVSADGAVVVGQHVGDLDNVKARDRMEREIEDLRDLFEVSVNTIVHDLHPDYGSTVYAEQSGFPCVAVQHHVAHVAACLAENQVDVPTLAASWDGTGMGTDGVIWGGEFLLVTGNHIRRVCSLRPFPLPGGESAIQQPRRSALGLLHASYGAELPASFADWTRAQFSEQELNTLLSMLTAGTHCVKTTSVGRLFDAFAAIAAGMSVSRFEGDVPMRFENLAKGDVGAYTFEPRDDPNGNLDWILDWHAALDQLACDLDGMVSNASISAKFHNGLADAILQLAGLYGVKAVALTGGCFQNRRLFEAVWERLRTVGLACLAHKQIPPGDGGIAFGQLAAASRGWTVDGLAWGLKPPAVSPAKR